jgi:hypothetical protein
MPSSPIGRRYPVHGSWYRLHGGMQWILLKCEETIAYGVSRGQLRLFGRRRIFSLRVLPCIVELFCVQSARMFIIQRLCRPGAEYLCCGKFLVPVHIYTVNQLLIVANSHTDVLTHGNTRGWPIIQIYNTFLRAYTTGIVYSYPCDMNHFIDRFIMGVRGCLDVDNSDCVFEGRRCGLPREWLSGVDVRYVHHSVVECLEALLSRTVYSHA